MSWSDDKKIFSRVDVISWNPPKKKNSSIYSYFIAFNIKKIGIGKSTKSHEISIEKKIEYFLRDWLEWLFTKWFLIDTLLC